MVANNTAVQRAQFWPVSSPPAVRAITTPRSRWTQPHVVKSEMMTPEPPTVTTLSLRIAARPHIALKKAPTNRMIPAKVAQPVGTYSSRGTEVLEGVGVVVAMGCPFTDFQD